MQRKFQFKGHRKISENTILARRSAIRWSSKFKPIPKVKSLLFQDVTMGKLMILKFEKCRITCLARPSYSQIRAIRGCKNFIWKHFYLTNDGERSLSLQSKRLITHFSLPNEFSSNTFSLNSKNSRFWARRTEISGKNFISDSISSPLSTICVSHNSTCAYRTLLSFYSPLPSPYFRNRFSRVARRSDPKTRWYPVYNG